MNNSLPPLNSEPLGITEQGEEPKTRTWQDHFFRLVPAFDSLRTYSWKALGADTVAGITVATVAVPQAMAHAMIAGLPPQYGLYTAIVMTAVGALVGCPGARWPSRSSDCSKRSPWQKRPRAGPDKNWTSINSASARGWPI